MNPVLIMGCQRSGTTLAGLLLGSHPKCFLVDEDEGAADCLYAFSNTEDNHIELDIHNHVQRALHKYQDPEKQFADQILTSIDSLILKCINQVYEYDQILFRVPGVKVIWLVRDVRDVICSMRNIEYPIEHKQVERILRHEKITQLYPTEVALLKKYVGHDHLRKALVWKIKTSLMDYAKQVSENIYPLWYEQIIKQPESTLKDAFLFLGHPMAVSVLNHHTAYKGMAIGNTVRNAPLNQESIGRWHSELTTREQSEIWELVGDYMEKLGYAFETGYEG